MNGFNRIPKVSIPAYRLLFLISLILSVFVVGSAANHDEPEVGDEITSPVHGNEDVEIDRWLEPPFQLSNL